MVVRYALIGIAVTATFVPHHASKQVPHPLEAWLISEDNRQIKSPFSNTRIFIADLHRIAGVSIPTMVERLNQQGIATRFLLSTSSTKTDIVKQYLKHLIEEQRKFSTDDFSIAINQHRKSNDKVSDLRNIYLAAEEKYFRNEALADVSKMDERKLFNDYAVSHLKSETHTLLDTLSESLLDLEVAHVELNTDNPFNVLGTAAQNARTDKIWNSIQKLESAYREAHGDVLKMIDRKSHLLDEATSKQYARFVEVSELTRRLRQSAIHYVSVIQMHPQSNAKR